MGLFDNLGGVVGNVERYVETQWQQRMVQVSVYAGLLFYLLSTGTLIETVRNTKVTKHAEGAAGNIQPKHLKYPIPLNEIQTNPVLLDSDPTNNGYR